MGDFDLTKGERREALAKANDARHERANIRKRLKAGEITMENVLSQAEDPIVGRMKVSMLLESMPGYGKAKASKVMTELSIASTRRIQGLGERQKRDLMQLF